LGLQTLILDLLDPQNLLLDLLGLQMLLLDLRGPLNLLQDPLCLQIPEPNLQIQQPLIINNVKL
jgi:hypothetical protein